jgi:6-phosphogluconolactonase (cycloisomerase 2 family)
MVHNFASGSGGGPLWISFDAIGRFAYVGGYTEIAEFKVNPISGALTANGTIAFTNPSILWGQLDPSGRFLFVTGADGTVSGFKLNGDGTLTPNGSVFLGDQMVGETIAFAKR